MGSKKSLRDNTAEHKAWLEAKKESRLRYFATRQPVGYNLLPR